MKKNYKRLHIIFYFSKIIFLVIHNEVENNSLILVTSFFFQVIGGNISSEN
jgi:hypothetical protein